MSIKGGDPEATTPIASKSPPLSKCNYISIKGEADLHVDKGGSSGGNRPPLPPSLPLHHLQVSLGPCGPPWAARRTDKKTKRGSEARQGESEREREREMRNVVTFRPLQTSKSQASLAGLKSRRQWGPLPPSLKGD